MKQIKFRAWDGKEYRYLFVINSETGEIIYNGMAKKDWILEQYTGLKDKNGVEIYEGDIIDIGGGYGGDNCHLSVSIKPNGVHFEGYPYWANPTLPDRIVIVGNIYEDGDLLK